MTHAGTSAERTKAAPDLGIVIPTYREADNIAALVMELKSVMPGAAIVVVDDSPDDDTVSALRGVHVDGLEVIKRQGKNGRGSAVLVGMRRLLEGGAAMIVEMDADHSHRPGELPGLVAQARADRLDLLIASRYLPESRITGWPLSRRVLSRGANGAARLLLRLPINDYTNGYRVYTRRAAELVVDRCGNVGSGFIALSEMLVTIAGAGMRVGERPSVFVNRTRGESSVGVREIASSLIGLWRTARLRQRPGSRT